MKPIFLELRHLKTLLALKETGSVSLAAKRVHLTQSALSHQIKLLEEQYGLTLFERKTTPLHFTPQLTPKYGQTTKSKVNQMFNQLYGELIILVLIGALLASSLHTFFRKKVVHIHTPNNKTPRPSTKTQAQRFHSRRRTFRRE